MDKSIISDLILNQNKNLTPNSFPNNTQNENISWGEEYAKLYEAPAEVIAVLSLFYGGISIIAIIGNALVIWIVATTRKMHTVTNLYIANLAFADVIIGMFCIPFQFQAALLQRWSLPEFMCAFCPFVQVLSVNVSVFTLTAIAVDRHRAIINPLRARPTRFFSKVIIVTIWIAATAFSIPCAIAFRVIQITETHREDGIITNVTRPFCENVNLSEEQLKTYRYYLVFVQYVVPFCVISSIYMQMAIRLWGSRTPGNAQDLRDMTLLRNKKKVIKMLIIVVVVFGVCWLPLQTYNILYVTWPQINEYRFINIIWFCCDWLAMSNSCYNPFIYGIYNEKFKREFNKRFSLCFCKFDAQDLPDRTVSIYTRASSIRSNYTLNNCNNNSTRLIHHRNNALVQQQQQQQQRQNHQQQQQHQFQNQQQKRISLFKLPDPCSNNGLNGTINSKRSFVNNNDCNNKSMLLFEMNENNKFKRTKNQKSQFQKQQQYIPDAFNTDKSDICNVYLEKDNEFWEHEFNGYDSNNALCLPKIPSNSLETSNNQINSSIPSSSDDSSVSLPSTQTHNTKLLSEFELNENKKSNSINYPNNNDNKNQNSNRSNRSSLKKTSNNIEMTELNLLGRENNNKSDRGIRFSVKFNNF